MILNLSTIKKLKDLNMYVSKGNNVIYECINNFKNRRGAFHLNQFSEVTFDLNKKSNAFNEIITNTRIYIDNLGWWISSTPSSENSDGIESKSFKLYSAEYELSLKNINNFYINTGDYGSINDVKIYDENNPSKSLLHLVLEKFPNWSIGTIHPELVSKMRTFSIESMPVYNFLTNEVAKTLHCIFIFDTENLTISAYPISKFGEYTDVYLSNETVIKSLSQAPLDETGVTTCIRVTGADDLDIRAVNCGFEYLYDLSYFYDRMSPGLLTSWTSYLELLNNSAETFKTKQLELNQLESTMAELKNRQPNDISSTTWADYGIDELEILLKTTTTTIKNYEKVGYQAHYSEYYNLKNKELNIKKELNVKNTQYAEYENDLSALTDEISALKITISKENNFSAEELKELSLYIKEGDYNDNTFAITSIYTEAQIQQKQYDLMVSAQEALSALAQPQYEIKTDIIKITKLKAFESNYDKFKLGNFLVVYLSQNYSLDERLISIEASFDDDETFDISFSNSTRSVSGMSDLDYLLDNMTGVSSKSYSNSAGSGGNGGGSGSKNSDDFVTYAELTNAINNMALSTSANFANDELNILTEMLNGKFSTIDADYVYSKIFEGDEAKLNELATHTITADWLKANEGLFDFLETKTLKSDVANIETILSGKIGTGDLQTVNLTSANSTIDQSFANSFIAKYIKAKEIIGEKISTNDFTIASDDGGLNISDNTITIKDSNDNVRVQIGEDENGQFSFLLLDETGTGTIIDSNGVTEKGIADGLIKSEKLASKSDGYNGISADKLDVNSVVTSINEGTTTIKSSLIYFDDEEQTLNTKLSSMTTSISQEIDNKIDNNLAYTVEIQSSKGNIFKGTTSSTLKAIVKKGNDEVDTRGTEYIYTWIKYRADGTQDTSWNKTGKSIIITDTEIDEKAIFNVNVATV